MEKLQRHLDTQAKKAVKQVTKRMLANKTSCGILAEQVAENEQAGETVVKELLANKTSRGIVAEQVAENEQVLEEVARNPKARETDTYRSILDEGQEKHARKAVMLVGQERCGSPSEDVKRRIEIITDLERLDRMLRRAAKASNWEEILETS